MNFSELRAAVLALTMLTLGVAGCVKAPNWSFARLPIGDDQPPSTAKGAAPFKVKVDGVSLAFHAPQVATAKSKTFAPRLEKLLTDGEPASARQLIYRHPELALEALRNALDQEPTPAVQFVAEEYDRWLKLSPADGWSKLLAASASRPAAAYLAARQPLLDKLQQGSPAAADIDAVAAFAQSKSATVIRLDAARTAAIAYLVALQPEKAAAVLEKACELASQSDRYQEHQLQLLQSDALRRMGQHEAADRAWLASVNRAAEGCRLQPPLFDPSYWDTASYLRPVKIDWPGTAIQAMLPLSPIPAQQARTAADAEAMIWGTIGQALLDRGDHESALLAFKRAETNATNPQTRDWLRLAEANALARVGQSSAATAVLAGCISSENPALAAAASACLGSIKCHAGDSDAGYRLLKKAMQSQQLDGWIGQADAEADFALTCLMRGDEKTGLQWLHAAQSRYEAQGETPRLAQSLSNEKEYWKLQKQTARVKEIELRLQTIR